MKDREQGPADHAAKCGRGPTQRRTDDRPATDADCRTAPALAKVENFIRVHGLALPP
jgi:hypothetical protein